MNTKEERQAHWDKNPFISDDIGTPHPADSIPIEVRDGDALDPYADSVGPVEIIKDARDFEASFRLLVAHLVSKGYGHAAIKRILKGEVVR